MIYFVANHFDTTTNGPAKFARELRRLYDPAQLIIATSDITSNQVRGGILRLPSRPRYIQTTVFTQLWRSFRYHKSLIDAGLRPSDVVVYNNIISSIYSTYRFGGLTIGFVNDSNNLQVSPTLSNLSNSISRLLLRGLEKFACARAAAVVVNSESLASELIEKYKIPAPRVHLLYKGTRIPAFKQRTRPSVRDTIRILFVKSDWQRGGLLDLLDACEISSNRYNIALDVVGVQASQLDRSIPEFATFYGPKSRDFVCRLLDSAHIFCVPSHSEALGVANIEAMAACVPVIATQVGGIPETTDNGRNCWPVQPSSPAQIAEQIATIIENPEKVHNRVAEAYEFVRKHFNIETAAKRLLNIINTVQTGAPPSQV